VAGKHLLAGNFLVFGGRLSVAKYFGRPDQQREKCGVHRDRIGTVQQILKIFPLGSFFVVKKINFAGEKNILFDEFRGYQRKRRDNFGDAAPKGTVMRSSFPMAAAAAHAVRPRPGMPRD